MKLTFAEPERHIGKAPADTWHPMSDPSSRRRIRAILTGVQTKPAVSAPTDQYEEEADRIAGALDSESARPMVCLRTRDSSHQAIASPLTMTQNLGPGEPLSAPSRALFESRLGHDFSQVRVHSDERAADAAQSVQARAFTFGSDIVFGYGQYSPGSSDGSRLLAHELAHVVQQSAGAGSSGGLGRPVVQRAPATGSTLDEEEFGTLPESAGEPARLARTTAPNPAAPAPPGPSPLPPAGSFTPLTGTARTDRITHGMSRDTGPMLSEIESEVFPTGGARPPCAALPPDFNNTLGGELSASLQSDVPSLTPASAPDPMGIAGETAQEAMPIISTHYAPHAPTRSPGAFMAIVSRKPANYGDPIRNNVADFAEFIEWYSGERENLRNLTADKCGMTRAWWNTFAAWLAGSPWNAAPGRVRERSALYDTYNTTVTLARSSIQFGRGFSLWNIPHTVTHEAMHLFQHADLDTQLGLLQNIRSSKDIFTEGMAEYLARGVRDQVVTAIQGHVPPPLSPGDEALARAGGAYPYYFDRVVAIRDILYRHGQDGEESIRRAFFLGEGWRFGLLETAAGVGSPIETDRPLPGPVDVHFATGGVTLTDPAQLDPIVAYAGTRSVARVEVVGRTDTTGGDAPNMALGLARAEAVRARFVAAGISAGRITVSSRGKLDQIPGGLDANRRATVTVIDPRNEFPGLPGPGRP